ncbi:MAG: YcxB family protein [Lachnospiraceae bacterium]|nr:YcxB family protein [Lachnospiraceae bacterium]
MKLDLDIKIRPKDLYDYMLYHTYTGLSGIIGTVCGIFMAAVYFMGYQIWYLIGGLIILFYLPVSLFMRSRKQYLANPAFKEPLHYKFDETGMSVSQGDSIESIEWDRMVKAVSTPGSIVLYTSRVNGSIFPKRELNDQKEALIKMISTHMSPKKVKIRGN